VRPTQPTGLQDPGASQLSPFPTRWPRTAGWLLPGDWRPMPSIALGRPPVLGRSACRATSIPAARCVATTRTKRPGSQYRRAGTGRGALRL